MNIEVITKRNARPYWNTQWEKLYLLQMCIDELSNVSNLIYEMSTA